MEENDLRTHLDRLHTTALGAARIQKNLLLADCDVVAWCKTQIMSPRASISRRGKNWYIATGSGIITVNASSYTVITAHRQ